MLRRGGAVSGPLADGPDMPEQADPNDAPPSTGPFYSTWGPLDGPILGRDHPPALGVVGKAAPGMPIGIAYPVGLVEHRRGPAKTFRLVIGKVELEGRWLC